MTLFSIHPSLPFLETAVNALVSGTLLPELSSPSSLRQATVFIPSRQAAQTFVRLLSSHHSSQPHIIPLGHLPEHFESRDLPPALSSQRLQILVATRLQERMMTLGEHSSLPTTYTLAHSLLQFLDTLTLNHISSEQIREAREEECQGGSGLLPLLLDVLVEDIPKILETQGAMTLLQRTKMQMERYREHLRTRRSPHPVLILGSTGSLVSTRKLMQYVNSLPNGIIILPGVDHESMDDTWLTYSDSPSHPQMLLSRFVQICGQTRKSITPLRSPYSSRSGTARAYLLSQAFATPEETSIWAEDTPERKLTCTMALDRLAIGFARNERHEASLIAKAIHEARLMGAQRPTLITPDRMLADYTFQELQRWSDPVLMTAPSSLSQTLAGRLAHLSLGLLTSRLCPAVISALLTHPWVTLGLDVTTYRACRPLWDRFFLRHLPPKGNLEILLGRIHELQDTAHPHQTPHPIPRKLQEAYGARSPTLHESLSQGIATLVAAYSSWPKEKGCCTLKDFMERHLTLLETLTTTPDQPLLQTRPEAKPLLDLFDASKDSNLSLSLDDYKALFGLILKDTQVFSEQSEPTGPYIQIAGLWEARFLTPDYVVLGGLTETSWPPSTPIEPIFGRALGAVLGLPPPEVRVGQSAHDFTQALCRTSGALITYSRKRNNGPVLPSRFLLRLRACLGENLWSQARAEGDRLCAVAHELEPLTQKASLEYKGRSSHPLPQHLPIPEILSVHALEQLMTDPRAFFTHHVLGLNPLLDRTPMPGPGMYGSLIHQILSRFTKDYPKDLPPNPSEAFLSIATEMFAPLKNRYEAIDALWWPKLHHMATTFIAWEEKRRPDIESIAHSIPGRVILKMPGGPLTITTLTDRLEKRRDGSYALIDFKTGTLPSQKEIHTGFALSLVLQAGALEQGTLGHTPPRAPYTLTYVQVTSKLKKFEEHIIQSPKEVSSLSEFVTLSLSRLEEKISNYTTTLEGIFS